MWLYLSVLLIAGLASAKVEDTDMPEIYYLHIKSDIRIRFATTQITSLMANTKNYSREANFNVILPDRAFISNFTMVIDGVEYPGEVKEKEQAKKDFLKAKKKGQSAGHVAQKPRDTNKFKISINVAARKKVRFELRYQELLQRRLGIYEHAIYVNPGQPVRDMSIQVFIAESKEIRFIQVPPLRSSDPTIPVNDTAKNPNAVISHLSLKTASVTYRPPVNNVTIDGVFIVKYDIDRRETLNGEILAVNGYFVHFFAPTDLEPIPKDILFILDTSGSMFGQKIKQLKDAMTHILNDMSEGDRFNMMDFNSRIKFWQKVMQPWNDKTKAKSLKWVKKLKASGGTNINLALVDGIQLVQNFQNASEGRSPIIVFLTDGSASTGETKGSVILVNVVKANQEQIPVFALSFGADADFKLLQKISLQNYAVARRIYEASDSAIQLKNFYNEISAALMTDLKFKYFGEEVDDESITNNAFHRYFNGTETVIAGRLTDNSISSISWNLVGSTSSGSVDHSDTSDTLSLSSEEEGIGLLSDEDIKGIPEKLWAYLTIKQILDKRTASDNITEKEELTNRALELSLKYKFVTPVTSMVVVKPEVEDDGDNKPNQTKPTGPTTTSIPLATRKTRPGVSRKRYGGGGATGDPHFLVYLHDLSIPVCFDINGKKGEMLTLLSDPVEGINITTQIVEGKTRYSNTGAKKTFMGRIFIRSPDVTLIVSPNSIIFNGRLYSWDNETVVSANVATMEINGEGDTLMVKIAKGQHFLIRRSLAGKRIQKIDYLNFFVVTGRRLSKEVSGIIGKFIHIKAMLKHSKRNKKGQNIGKLIVINPKNRSEKKVVPVVLKYRADLLSPNVPCWVMHRTSI